MARGEKVCGTISCCRRVRTLAVGENASLIADDGATLTDRGATLAEAQERARC